MIKVLTPELPAPFAYQPLLLEMQRTGEYTNGAPMIRRFEQDMERLLLMCPCVAVSNGTAAIELALMHEGTPGDRVLIPSACFVGAAQAIKRVGMIPVICDVDPVRWALTPQMALSAQHHFDIALPVCTFGMTQPAAIWAQFQRETGKRVVIDGGGTIVEQVIAVTTAFSLHATKTLGIGEGGIVACMDSHAAEAIRTLANFGPGGTNAKLSGISAAVGIAASNYHFLQRKIGKLQQLRQAYQRYLEPLKVVTPPFYAPSAMMMPVLLPCRADAVMEALEKVGIETKQWYYPYLHDRAEFDDCVQLGDLSISRMLSERLIGLPMHTYLTEDNVPLIVDALRDAITIL